MAAIGRCGLAFCQAAATVARQVFTNFRFRILVKSPRGFDLSACLRQ
jgi:hypothetical protein